MKKEKVNELPALRPLLEEYRGLRREIEVRLNSEQKLLTVSILLFVAVITATQFFLESNVGNVETHLFRLFLPIISIIFSGISFISIEHDNMMFYIAKYIVNVIKPQIQELCKKKKTILTSTIFDWENYRKQEQYHSIGQIWKRPLSASRYILSIIPTIWIIGFYIYQYFSYFNQITIFEWFWIFIAIVAFILTIVIGIFSSNLYMIEKVSIKNPILGNHSRHKST